MNPLAKAIIRAAGKTAAEPTFTHRVTLTIVLDVECATTVGPDALSAAHFRAEQFAARVLLCGDKGGPIDVVDSEAHDASVAVIPPRATRLVTRPGMMEIRMIKTGKKRAPKGPTT